MSKVATGKSEYRERQEYRESYPGGLHRSAGIGQAAPYILTGLMLIITVMGIGGWMLFQWWIKDAWNTNPIGVLTVNTIIVSLVGYVIWWNLKVRYDRHEVWKRRQLAEIGVLEVQPRVIESQADKGFNTEIIDAEGSAVRTINPISIAPASNTTNNYLGAPDEEGAEEEEQRRPTIAELLPLIERNSFEVPLGSSIIGNGTVITSFEDVHIKIIGSSRKGKSCLAAAILDLVTQTHDPHVVRIALLDLENKTSRLFEHLGEHIAVLPTIKGRVSMHARSVPQVAEYLHYIRNEMDRRYGLPENEQEKQPHILVYIEEFLSLKKHKDLDKQERATLADDLNELAIRGLKVLIHLMACAQVDYADDDLKPFANNFGLNISFAVRPPAAQAAGFVCSELLASNWQSKTPGQCVVEGTACNDLINAPDYDVKAKLKVLGSGKQIEKQSALMALPQARESGFQPHSVHIENQFGPAPQAALAQLDGEQWIISDFDRKLEMMISLLAENQDEQFKQIWRVSPGPGKEYRRAKTERSIIAQHMQSLYRREA